MCGITVSPCYLSILIKHVIPIKSMHLSGEEILVSYCGKAKRGLCRRWGILPLSVGWLMVQFLPFSRLVRGGGREERRGREGRVSGRSRYPSITVWVSVL